MSVENVEKFIGQTKTNPALMSEIEKLKGLKREELHTALAALSERYELPFTAEEFCSAVGIFESGELSETDLDSVSGGGTAQRSWWI